MREFVPLAYGRGTRRWVRRSVRMELDARHVWAALPAKMKLLLLHVRRAERDLRAPHPVAAAVSEPPAPISIEPIAHRRVS